MWTKMVGKLLKISFNFNYQSEEEAGSAGEQPASNKIEFIL